MMCGHPESTQHRETGRTGNDKVRIKKKKDELNKLKHLPAAPSPTQSVLH